jgi:hypothetical protein
LIWIITAIIVWLIWRDAEPITDSQTAQFMSIVFMAASGAAYFAARWRAKKRPLGLVTDGRFTAAMFYGLYPLAMGVAASLTGGVNWPLWASIGMSVTGAVWPFSILNMQVPYDPDM